MNDITIDKSANLDAIYSLSETDGGSAEDTVLLK